MFSKLKPNAQIEILIVKSRIMPSHSQLQVEQRVNKLKHNFSPSLNRVKAQDYQGLSRPIGEIKLKLKSDKFIPKLKSHIIQP